MNRAEKEKVYSGCEKDSEPWQLNVLSPHPQFFPGVSHNIHMERPELVNESVDSWLRRRKLDHSAMAQAVGEDK